MIKQLIPPNRVDTANPLAAFPTSCFSEERHVCAGGPSVILMLK